MKINKKEKIKQKAGITLIALVITIIVLLILAGISISMLSGDNSILKQAGNARDITGEKSISERVQLAYMATLANGNGEITEPDLISELTKEFGEHYKGLKKDQSNKPIGATIDEKDYNFDGTVTPGGGGDTTPTTIAEAKTASGGTVKALSNDDTTILKDDLENEVKVPKGFGIAEDSGTKVEEGIVIEDADSTRQTYKSQFVWVPVGTGIKVSTEISESGTVDIPLGRYVFNTSTGEVDETLSKTQPSDQLKTPASSSIYFIEGLTEETTSNTHAKNIATFLSKTNSSKGYYIARYEAGINANTDQYAYANCSGYGTSLTYGDLSNMFAKDGTVKPLSIKGKGVWNAVTQGEAATISRSMYNTSSDKVTSDLINSYAWDTAILFIQKCGNNGNDSGKYSIQRGYSAISPSARQLTGENKLKYQPGGTTARSTAIFDTQCKICDMAGNVYEWSTETCSSTSNPCVDRGGYCNNTNYYTASRYDSTTGASYSLGFRPLLYL